MSMFHELMMRKKEETMYATIKGTLTENDGEISGFSDSNYLELQQPFAPTGSWEVVICVTPTTYTLSHAKYFFGCYGTGNIVLGTTASSKFKVFISTNNGSSYNIQLTPTENIVANTLYYVKVVFDGSKYYIEQSIDGINYVGRSEEASSDSISSATVYIGKAYQDGYYWTNTVNLSNSYIKLGSTKYKLQAVVGYTIVGSPTITDGVVSGFTKGDYVKVANMPLENNYEINIPFNYSTAQEQAIFSFGRGDVSFLRLTSAGKFIFYLLFNYTLANAVVLTSDKIVYANTDYIIKLKGNNGIHQMLLSSDNGASWELFDTKEYNFTIPSNTFNFGVATRIYTVGFGGSINMNNTYIKINNKLWFNGQQS